MFRYQQWIELLKLRHFEKFLLFIIGNYYMFFQKKVQFCANLFNDFLFISKQLLKHFRNNLLFKYNLCPIFGPTYIFVPFRLYHYQKCLSVINNFHWKAKRTILRRTFLYVNGMDFNMCGVIEEIKIHHLLKSGRLQRKIKQPTVKLIEWKIIKNFKKHFHDFFAAASSSAYRQKPGSIPLLLKYVLVFQISQKVLEKYNISF